MGNCFAYCFQTKESSSMPKSSETSSELMTDKKVERAKTARIKRAEKTRKNSPMVRRRLLSQKKNRVGPCLFDVAEEISDNSLPSSAHFIYPVSGSSNSSVRSNSSDGSFGTRSGSSCVSASYEENPSRETYTLSDGSRNSDSSSDSTSSSSTQNDVSRASSAEVKPGVTQGRLIIVQPYRSFSGSYDSSSCERIHNEQKLPAAFGSSSDASSFDSFSENMVQFDECSSEEESCRVYPTISN